MMETVTSKGPLIERYKNKWKQKKKNFNRGLRFADVLFRTDRNKATIEHKKTIEFMQKNVTEEVDILKGVVERQTKNHTEDILELEKTHKHKSKVIREQYTFKAKMLDKKIKTYDNLNMKLVDIEHDFAIYIRTVQEVLDKKSEEIEEAMKLITTIFKSVKDIKNLKAEADTFLAKEKKKIQEIAEIVSKEKSG